MNLTLRQATAYFNVDESTVRRWIKQRGLPVHRANERLYVNAIELWEWATENGIAVSQELLLRSRETPDEVPPLSDMLVAGGIHHDVGGEDKSGVLREVVSRLPLPPQVDRDFVFSVLEAREAMGSTGIGEGIAIPHVRNPILLQVADPQVTLCLLRHAVDFDAIDGLPVFALFTAVSPTVPTHLRTLARLSLVLRDLGLRRLLEQRAAAEVLLRQIREVESRPAEHPARRDGSAR
jgi:PTS system nitrogen regulatory IIA component